MNIVRKALLASTLAATALVTATPAMAEHRDGRRGETAAIAIGAGIVGLAVGLLATSGRHDRWDDRYYVRDGWYYNDGYYYNRSGYRYSRGDWDRRYGHRGYDRRQSYYRGGYDHGDRWDGRDRRSGYGDPYYYRRGY